MRYLIHSLIAIPVIVILIFLTPLRREIPDKEYSRGEVDLAIEWNGALRQVNTPIMCAPGYIGGGPFWPVLRDGLRVAPRGIEFEEADGSILVAWLPERLCYDDPQREALTETTYPYLPAFEWFDNPTDPTRMIAILSPEIQTTPINGIRLLDYSVTFSDSRESPASFRRFWTRTRPRYARRGELAGLRRRWGFATSFSVLPLHADRSAITNNRWAPECVDSTPFVRIEQSHGNIVSYSLERGIDLSPPSIADDVTNMAGFSPDWASVETLEQAEDGIWRRQTGGKGWIGTFLNGDRLEGPHHIEVEEGKVIRADFRGVYFECQTKQYVRVFGPTGLP